MPLYLEWAPGNVFGEDSGPAMQTSQTDKEATDATTVTDKTSGDSEETISKVTAGDDDEGKPV